MTIKHIVITGGGHIGLSSLGILTETNRTKIWNFKNIETIWGTSSGSMIAVMLCLKMDFETINKYTLERPWNFLSITTEKIINLISEKGIFGIDEYNDFYRPLFLSCDLNLNTTMKELYEYSNIELNMITTELDEFKTVVINYKTFPDLKVIEGIIMSSSIPLLIKPLKYNDKYYFDGGLFVNFPITMCQEETKCTNDEILGIRREKESKRDEKITTMNGLIDYLFIFITKLLDFCHKSPDTSLFPNIYSVNLKTFNINDIKKLTEPLYRREIFNYGINLVTPNNDISDNTIYDSININDLSDNVIIENNIIINEPYDREQYDISYHNILTNNENPLFI